MEQEFMRATIVEAVTATLPQLFSNMQIQNTALVPVLNNSAITPAPTTSVSVQYASNNNNDSGTINSAMR
jgi:hypothetical protein